METRSSPHPTITTPSIMPAIKPKQIALYIAPTRQRMAENTVMHVLVEDVDAWWRHIESLACDHPIQEHLRISLPVHFMGNALQDAEAAADVLAHKLQISGVIGYEHVRQPLSDHFLG